MLFHIEVAERGKNMPQKFCALGILWVSLGNAVCVDLGSAAPWELIRLSAKSLSPLVNFTRLQACDHKISGPLYKAYR